MAASISPRSSCRTHPEGVGPRGSIVVLLVRGLAAPRPDARLQRPPDAVGRARIRTAHPRAGIASARTPGRLEQIARFGLLLRGEQPPHGGRRIPVVDADLLEDRATFIVYQEAHLVPRGDRATLQRV